MHGKPSKVTLTSAGQKEQRTSIEKRRQMLCQCVVDSRVVCLVSLVGSSLFSGLPDSFEVARYHSLHGIKEELPPCLEVTALSEDGCVMGIQHTELPFAAVQFHPESILTSPAHGMMILQNAIQFLQSGGQPTTTAAAAADGGGLLESSSFAAEFASVVDTITDDIFYQLDGLPVSDLKEMLRGAGLSSGGTKKELILRLTLWTHKSTEYKTGTLWLEKMTVPELRELKNGLGLKGTLPTKGKLLTALHECLNIGSPIPSSP
eukprot:scaffold100722_cov45-Attheya_sp.AAC.2